MEISIAISLFGAGCVGDHGVSDTVQEGYDSNDAAHNGSLLLRRFG